MKKYLLLTLTLLTIGGNARSQDWKAANPPVGDDITSIDFVSPDIGFACTRPGEIIRTTDGGKTWSARRVAFDISLEDIGFFDAKTGLVCGKAGALYRTDDGGDKWVSVSPIAGDSTQIFFSVDLFDSRNGLAIGMDRRGQNQYGALAYRTSDGGLTWKRLEPLGMGYSEIFYSPQAGVVFPAFGQLIRSSDLGKSWNKLTTPEGGIARDVAVFGNTVMMAGPQGFVGISPDGGQTWAKAAQDPAKTLVAVALVDARTAYVGGLGSTMLYSADGGQNWSDELLVRSFDVLDLVVAGTRIWAVGSGGAVIYKDLK